MKKSKINNPGKFYFSLIGMISGFLLIVFGALAIFGVLGDAHYYTDSPYRYDHGYTSFGADFYTYVSNNAAYAAEAASAAVSNVRATANILKNTIGISMICFGLFGICGFGTILSGCVKKPKALTETTTPLQAAPQESEYSNDFSTAPCSESTAASDTSEVNTL